MLRVPPLPSHTQRGPNDGKSLFGQSYHPSTKAWDASDASQAMVSFSSFFLYITNNFSLIVCHDQYLSTQWAWDMLDTSRVQVKKKILYQIFTSPIYRTCFLDSRKCRVLCWCHSQQTPNSVFRVLSIPYTLALKAASIAVVLDHHTHPRTMI